MVLNHILTDNDYEQTLTNIKNVKTLPSYEQVLLYLQHSF